MTLDEALATWINGNRTDAAAWLAAQPRSMTLAFWEHLHAASDGMVDSGFANDYGALCTLLDSAEAELAKQRVIDEKAAAEHADWCVQLAHESHEADDAQPSE